MIYKTLTHQEVEELYRQLGNKLPGTAKIFYVIRSFLAGLLPGKEVIVDQWPEWTSVVLRTCSESETQPYFRHTYMCHAKSTSALKYFIQRPDVVNWRKPARFTGVPRDVAPAISSMCIKHRGRITSLEPRFMYAWTRRDLPPEPKIPEGLVIGKLTPDDAVTLRRDWEGSRYREDLEGYFRTVISHYDSSCLRDADGELLAYACMQFNGSIAMLYVKPEHRDKDYFRIVLSDLARKRLRNGDVAYGFIPTNDSELVDQMRDMDFVWVPRGDMVWMDYEPLQIKHTSPLNQCSVAARNSAEDGSKSFDCVCSEMAKFSKAYENCRREFGSSIQTLRSGETTRSNMTTFRLSAT